MLQVNDEVEGLLENDDTFIDNIMSRMSEDLSSKVLSANFITTYMSTLLQFVFLCIFFSLIFISFRVCMFGTSKIGGK